MSITGTQVELIAPPCLFRLPPTLRLPIGAVGVVGRGTLVFLVGLGLGKEEDEEYREAVAGHLRNQDVSVSFQMNVSTVKVG